MMQRIATPQSDVATLAVNIGGNEASSEHASSDFRDILNSHKQPTPEVAKPVQHSPSAFEKAASKSSDTQADSHFASETESKGIASKGEQLTGSESPAQRQSKGVDKKIPEPDSAAAQAELTSEGENRASTEANKTGIDEPVKPVKGELASSNSQAHNKSNTPVDEVPAVIADSSPLDVDWLELLSDIEYAKSNNLTSGKATDTIDPKQISRASAADILVNEQDDINPDPNLDSHLESTDLRFEDQILTPDNALDSKLTDLNSESKLAAKTHSTPDLTAETKDTSLQSVTIDKVSMKPTESQQQLLDITEQLGLSPEESELVEHIIAYIDKTNHAKAAQGTKVTPEHVEQVELSVDQLLTEFFSSKGDIEVEVESNQQNVGKFKDDELDLGLLASLLQTTIADKNADIGPSLTNANIVDETTTLDSQIDDMGEQLIGKSQTPIFDIVDKSVTAEQTEDTPPDEVKGPSEIATSVVEVNQVENEINEFQALSQEIQVETESDQVLPSTSLDTDDSPSQASTGNSQKTVATIAALAPTKLEVALSNLAETVEQLAIQASEQTSTQNVASKGAELGAQLANTGFHSDFVKALKQGIEDFKQKMKMGVESKADLNTLVTDALNSVTSVDKSAAIAPVQLEQALSSFAQTLDMGLRLGQALERVATSPTQMQANVVKEVAFHTQTEQVKQAQQQMLGQDKAINITRAEGQQQLADKVRWMVNQNNLQADIRLDPAELGSVKVRVNLSGESASVNFVVQSQQARDALEQAAPRLKDMLDQQGIELGQSSIQQEQNDSQQEQQGFAQGSMHDEQPELSQADVVEQKIVNGRLGGIDYFV